MAAKPPAAATRKIGKVTLRIDERELRIEGLSYPVTLAAFSGPAYAAAPGAAELARLRAQKPDLVLVLGDVGDDRATANATLASLGQLGVPILVVAGGRDTRTRITDAIVAAKGAGERIIDVTSLRVVRFARDTLVPVGGAPDGRYALSDDACGYSKADLQQLARELGDAPDSRHWLIAWQAPSDPGKVGVARTEDGLDLGSASLAELAAHVAAPGGIFGFPHVQVMRPIDAARAVQLGPGMSSANLQVVVPRVSGNALERSDGSSVAASFALLRLDASGLQVVAPKEDLLK